MLLKSSPPTCPQIHLMGSSFCHSSDQEAADHLSALQRLNCPQIAKAYFAHTGGPMVDLGATEISIQTIENQKSKPKAIIDMDSNDFEIWEWLSRQYNNYCYRKKSFQNLTWWPYIEGKTISISRVPTLAVSHSHAKRFHCGDGDLMILISSEGRAKLISIYRETSTCETEDDDPVLDQEISQMIASCGEARGNVMKLWKEVYAAAKSMLIYSNSAMVAYLFFYISKNQEQQIVRSSKEIYDQMVFFGTTSMAVTGVGGAIFVFAFNWNALCLASGASLRYKRGKLKDLQALIKAKGLKKIPSESFYPGK